MPATLAPHQAASKFRGLKPRRKINLENSAERQHDSVSERRQTSIARATIRCDYDHLTTTTGG